MTSLIDSARPRRVSSCPENRHDALGHDREITYQRNLVAFVWTEQKANRVTGRKQRKSTNKYHYHGHFRTGRARDSSVFHCLRRYSKTHFLNNKRNQQRIHCRLQRYPARENVYEPAMDGLQSIMSHFFIFPVRCNRDSIHDSSFWWDLVVLWVKQTARSLVNRLVSAAVLLVRC